MNFIDIQDNFLQNSYNYIIQNTTQNDFNNTYIFCTSISVASHLKTYFYQKYTYCPKIVAIGSIDPFLLVDILHQNGNDIDISKIFTQYQNKTIHDMDKDLLIYNFFSKYLRSLDNNLVVDSVESTASQTTKIINLITTTNGFIESLKSTNNNFGEALNIFIQNCIDKIPSDLSIRAQKDFVNTTKASIELSNYLEQNNLETKMQKRVFVIENLCKIIKNLTQPKLFFVGQNGENNLYNKLCIAAKDYKNAYFISYLTQGQFSNKNQYPNIDKLKQILNVKQEQNNNTLPLQDINFIETNNIQEQYSFISNFVNNTNEKSKIKSKILILAANQNDAGQIFTLLNNQLLQNNINKECKIFNSFGFELTKTNQYLLYISLLKLSQQFNSVLFLSVIHHDFIASYLNLTNNEVSKLDAICREGLLNPTKYKTLQSFATKIILKQDDELKNKILQLHNILNHFSQDVTNLKDSIDKSYKMFETFLTTEAKNTTVIKELQMFLQTDLNDINDEILNNFYTNQNTITRLIKLVEYFAKNRSFQDNQDTLESSNICILSLAEARYLSFDTACVLNFNDANFGFKKQNTISNSIKALFSIKTTSQEFYDNLACFKDVIFSCKKVFTLYSRQNDVVSGLSNPSPFLNYFHFTKHYYKNNNNIEIIPPDNNVFLEKAHKIIPLSNTCLDLLVNNRREFLIKYILKIQQINSLVAKPNAMDIGIIIHKVLANLGGEKNIKNICNISKQEFIIQAQNELEKQYLQKFYETDYNFHFWHQTLNIVASILYNEFQNAYSPTSDIDFSNNAHFKIIAENQSQESIKSQIKIHHDIFEIKAIPDRIDIYQNKVKVVDYKTGTANLKGIQMEIINYILTNNNVYNNLSIEYAFYQLKQLQTTSGIEIKKIDENFTNNLTDFLLTYISDDFCFA